MAELRKMELGDLNRVVAIIHDHDEDDGEAAKESYENGGFDDQFVLELDDKVIGVTGFKAIEACEGSYWLTWTYLSSDHRRQGYGRQMLESILEKLREKNARKLFVKVSDYEDPDDGKIYEAALNLYKSIGFKVEVVSKDFYDEGEDQLILGLVLNETSAEDVQIADEKVGLEFKHLFEIAETEGAYSFTWTTVKKSFFSPKKNFTVTDLKIGLESVQNNGGRAVFLTFPSNLPLIHDPLQKAGFELIGQLNDYYEPGLHELHFCCFL